MQTTNQLVMYHGTTQDAAKSILQVGLMPHRETAFQIRDQFNDKLRDKEVYNVAYLTPSLDVAVNFARFRAKYERAQYNQLIPGTWLNQYKDTAKRNPDAKPAVLAIKLPNDIRLAYDPEMDGAYVTPDVIPPENIKVFKAWDFNSDEE